jgi:NAD(P)-dependent dehydrogenase (short-subunit alcohol dehydrogenase family)
MAEWLNSAHTAVITGATGVIGAEIARGVVATGATVILAVRDTTKVRLFLPTSLRSHPASLSHMPTLSRTHPSPPPAQGQALAASLTESTGNTRVSVEPVDFDSLRSVARLAEAVGTKHGGSLHLLVNCVATVPKDRELTTDGLERQFAVNALSYFATMTAFHPLLAAGAAELSAAAAAGTAGATTARARVVNVAAFFAGDVDFRDLEFTSRPYQALRGFKQSKALVRLLTGAAARKYKRDGIAVSCCHPGVTRSPVLAGLGKFARKLLFLAAVWRLSDDLN